MFVAICVLLAICFIYLQWAGYLINDLIRRPYGWSTVWAKSALPPIFFIYYTFFIVACLYLAFDYERKTNNMREKKQAKILYITAAISLALGSLIDVIFPLLGIGLLPNGACVVIVVWAGGLVYAITKYRLMTLTPAAAATDILATMGDSLIMTDMNGKIISANRVTSNLLGYTTEELSGRDFDSILAGEETGSDVFLREIREQGRISSRDANYRTKDGNIIPVLLSSSIVKDKEGEPAGVVVTAHEMTEHRKMELDLRKSEEKYRTLVDHALVGIGIHQNSILIFANKELASMLGYTLEECIGLSIAGMIYPDERDFAMARASRRQAGCKEPETYEIRFLKKDGNVLYALISNAVIEYNGQPATMITVADITDTKARKELERANKELEAFSYSVSHDLRAPLRSIDGFSQALLEDYEDSLDETGRDYLRRIRAASQRMGQLIDDLLKLSRVTRAEMRYTQVDLSAMAKTIAGQIKEMDPERAVEFFIAEEVTAQGDASLLQWS